MSEPLMVTTNTYCKPTLTVAGDEPLNSSEQRTIDWIETAVMPGGIIFHDNGATTGIYPFSGVTEIIKPDDISIEIKCFGVSYSIYMASLRVRDAVYAYLVDMLKHYLSHPFFLPVSTSTKKYETRIQLY